MPPLLDRLRRSLAGSQLATLESQVTDLQGIAARLAEAYNAGSYELPPTELVRQLHEYDTSLISDLVDQMGWEAVSGYGGYSEAERQRAVNDSTRMAKYSTLAKWAINLWTFYGLSSNVDIVPDDDSRDAEDEHSAQSVWTEFWDADRNQAIIAKDRLDELSRWLLIKGERFFAFYSSQIDGETTIRSIRPEEVTEIYTNPDDSSDVWFYKRQWTDASGQSQILVYPNWEIFFGEKVDKHWSLIQSTHSTARGLDLASKPQTDVCVLFVPFTQLDEDSVRGWPLLAPHGTAWLRAQRDFMQDRAAVTRSVAAFVRRYKVSGGSRAVDSIRSTLMSALQSGSTTESNYPPIAGSSEILNRAIDAQDLPLQTGAVDAKTDSEMFSWFALLAGGVFPHYAGMGDAYRLATASAMERPLQLQFSLYRNQLGAMFRKIVRIVLQFHERYNKQVKYDTHAVSISLDRLVEVDLPVISSALTQINDSIIQPLIESNSLTQEARNTILASMLRLVFQSLGMEDASEIVNETIFTEPEEQVAPEPKEPEKPEEPKEPEVTPSEEPEETTQEEAAAPPTEQLAITDEDIENWLTWMQDFSPDLMELVLADENELREGGPGSGHWGHAGRPGEIGGSVPSGGVIARGSGASRDTAGMSMTSGPTAKARQQAAAAADKEAPKPEPAVVKPVVEQVEDALRKVSRKRTIEEIREELSARRVLNNSYWITRNGDILEATYGHSSSAGEAMKALSAEDRSWLVGDLPKGRYVDNIKAVVDSGVVRWHAYHEWAIDLPPKSELRSDQRWAIFDVISIVPTGTRVIASVPGQRGLLNSDELKDRLMEAEEEADPLEEGGPGSGHYGHAGRPPDEGGSAPTTKPLSHKFMRDLETDVEWLGDDLEEGGPNSGFHGHKGRPGLVGGSVSRTSGGSTYFDGEMANPSGKDTFAQYRNEDGSFTPERQALHDKIVNKFFEDATPVENPQSFLMGGGPAAGKTTVIKKGYVNIPENHVLANSDEVKVVLPEYSKERAFYVHEESSYLAKVIAMRAASENYNVLLDGTGDGSIEHLSKTVGLISPHNQPVHAYYLTLPTKEAVARSKARFERGGRMVPEIVIRKTHAGVSRMFPALEGKNLFASLQLFDTSGSEPVLVLKQSKGKFTILDPVAYQRFLAKAEE